MLHNFVFGILLSILLLPKICATCDLVLFFVCDNFEVFMLYSTHATAYRGRPQ